MVYFHQNLIENDPEIFELVKEEQEKQRKGLQLIASENYPSKSVCETLSSCLSVHYVDEYPTMRQVFNKNSSFMSKFYLIFKVTIQLKLLHKDVQLKLLT